MTSRNDADTLDTQAGNIEGLHFPSLEEIFQTQRPATEPPRAETLPLQEQEALLYSVDDALKRANEGDTAAFEGMLDALSKLWHCQSQFLLRATETLANGSRNRQYIQPVTTPVADRFQLRFVLCTAAREFWISSSGLYLQVRLWRVAWFFIP
jgi:hypothetical protein